MRHTRRETQSSPEWASLRKLSRLLLRHTGEPIEQTLAKALDTLSPSSELTSAARIEVRGKVITNVGFRQGKQTVSHPLKIGGEKVGLLEVQFADSSPASAETPTLLQRAMVECAAAYLGLFVERFQASDALRISAAQLSAVGSLARDGIWVVDENGVTTYVNPRMEEIVGTSSAELIGSSAFDLLAGEADNAPVLRSALRHSGNTSSCEIQLSRKDGRQIWVKLEVPPPRSAAERVSDILVVVSDITQAKMRQIEIVRRSVFDELLSQMLSRFAACPVSEIGAKIRQSLKSIASYIGVSHAWVVVFSPDSSEWGLACEWSRAGSRSSSHTMAAMPVEALSWSRTILSAGRSVTFSAVDNIPEEAAAEYKVWTDTGCVCRLCVPIRTTGGDVIGCLGVHSHDRQIAWSEVDLAHITLAGNAIALALERDPTWLTMAPKSGNQNVSRHGCSARTTKRPLSGQLAAV